MVAISVIDKMGCPSDLLVDRHRGAWPRPGARSRPGRSARDRGEATTRTGCSATSAGIVALLAVDLFVVFFGVSWKSVVWVLLGEMFNNKIRASALAVSAAMQWVANFIVSTTFPPIAYNLGLGVAYGLYAAFAALSLVFVIAFIKETKGKTLEEMR